VYTEISRFEWDSTKAIENARKHGITFEQATLVFSDPQNWTAEDVGHSHKERRQLVIGEVPSGRLLLVVFTMRPGQVARIISARAASRRERRQYHEKK